MKQSYANRTDITELYYVQCFNIKAFTEFAILQSVMLIKQMCASTSSDIFFHLVVEIEVVECRR